MNTYKIRKYSHKINISIKNNDFNKINIGVVSLGVLILFIIIKNNNIKFL